METFEIEVTSKCLNLSGHNPPNNVTYETVREGVQRHIKKAVPTIISFVFSLYLQPSDYDPLSVNMGSLTVYRFTLRCKCNRNALQTDSKTGKLQKCGQFMPFDQQGWPSYAGIT